MVSHYRDCPPESTDILIFNPTDLYLGQNSYKKKIKGIHLKIIVYVTENDCWSDKTSYLNLFGLCDIVTGHISLFSKRSIIGLLTVNNRPFPGVF